LKRFIIRENDNCFQNRGSMRIGIYPGSFDPVTLGHLDIIVRASRLVDQLIIGVLVNGAKSPMFSMEERIELLRRVTKDLPNVIVEKHDGLLVDFARQKNASILVRGLRAVTDFEYELQIAQTNHKLSDGQLDTMFLVTNLEYAYLSSSGVKEIAYFKGDISQCVPDFVAKMVYEKYGFNADELMTK